MPSRDAGVQATSAGQESGTQPLISGTADAEEESAALETWPLLVESNLVSDLNSQWVGTDTLEGLPWWRVPSAPWIIAPFALFVLAFGGTIVAKITLFLDLVCSHNVAERALQSTLLDAGSSVLGRGNLICNRAEVQRRVSALLLGCNLTTGILSALVTPRLSELADRYGRTRIMAIGWSGLLASQLVVIVVAKFSETVDYRWVFLGAVFDGLGGSFTAVSILAQSYICDCTPPSRRTNAIGAFQGGAFAGLAIGPFLAGLLAKATGNLTSVFYFAAVCYLFCIFFLVFVTPESPLQKQQQLARDDHATYSAAEHEARASASWLSRLHLVNPFASLAALVPRGPGTSAALRQNLVSLAVADTIIFSVAVGSIPVVLLYAQTAFSWGNFESSVFLSTLASVRVALLLALLPALGYVLRSRAAARRLASLSAPEDQALLPAVREKNSGADEADLWTIRSSFVCDILGSLGYLFSTSPVLFQASGVVTAFGGLGSAVCQTALSKHVPPARLGRVMGAFGLLQATGRLIAPIVFNGLYFLTVESFPQAIFVALLGLYSLAFLLVFFVRPHVFMTDIDSSGHGDGEGAVER